MAHIKCYLINNLCYKRAGRRTADWGVLIHDTATIGATPKNFVKSWDVEKPNGRTVMVHAFCDDEDVYNTLPYEYECWGCGSGVNGCGNKYYVQIEMCIPKDIYFEKSWVYRSKNPEETKAYIHRQVDVVVDWAVERLLEMGIREVNEKTVTSHYELHAKGMASDHGDPKSYLSLAGLTMNDLREMIKTRLLERVLLDESNEKVKEQILVGDSVYLKPDAVQWDGNSINSSYMSKLYKVKTMRYDGRTVLTIDGVVMYAVDVKYLTKYKPVGQETEDKEQSSEVLESYTVKVTDPSLNIRKGPGTAFPIVGCIKDKGVYTIVEENGRWGRLKSGAGWIHLAYTKRTN